MPMFVPYRCHQEQIFDKKQEKKVYCVSMVKWKYRGHCGEEAMVVGVWGRGELCSAAFSLPLLIQFRTPAQGDSVTYIQAGYHLFS